MKTTKFAYTNMRTLTVTILTFLMLTIFIDPTRAQQPEIDKDRLNRDIRIMERAITELFRLENQKHFSVNLPGFSIDGGLGAGNVKGDYIHGYGVIFSIPDVTSRRQGFFFLDSNVEREGQSLKFSTGIHDEDKTVNEEGVIARITEFLMNYAPSIGQLDSQSRVTVIYGSELYDRNQVRIRSGRVDINGRESGRFLIQGRDDQESPDSDEIPVIAMSVTVENLEAFRSGRINADAFLSEIETEILRRDELQRTDLNIFANILETGLRDTQHELFKLNTKPVYLLLDSFGVIFHVDLSRSPAFYIGNVIDNISIRPFEFDLSDSMNSIRFNENQFHINLDSLRLQFSPEHFSEEDRENLQNQLDAAREKVEEARNQLNERLPQIMEQSTEAMSRAMNQQREYRMEIERQRELSQDL
jgi:hypothetical protein